MSVGRYKAYPEYKDSAVEWLGKLPSHWEARKLKFSCQVFPSNVDKKSHEGETPVHLCNYTDVYYNETITADMDFMAASASSQQIAKFTLRAGDTIITKDSETADDIAIAAYVPVDLPGVVCGYHLSMVRPFAGFCGAFVKRLFDSTYAKSCFAVRANGLTRVGLGQYELDNVELPFPSLPEQTQIAAFLDHETAKIDRLIEKQQALISLLKEKRQAVISHAVTKGLNPHAPLKDSGIEWLGPVPEHWIVRCVKHAFTNLDYRRIPLSSEERSMRSGEFDYYGASGVIDKIDAYIFDEPTILVGEDGANLVNRATPLAYSAKGRYWVNNHAHILRAEDGLVDYWAEAIEHIDVNPIVSGSAQPKLTAEALGNLKICFPPKVEERLEISGFIEEQKQKFDTLIDTAGAQVTLLQERRTALISAAVTGKIDVRHWQPPVITDAPAPHGKIVMHESN